MAKQKIIRFLGAIGLFFSGILTAGFAEAQQMLYGPPQQSLYGVAPLYGVTAAPPLWSIIQTLLLPFIILVAFIIAIVLGVRAINRRRKK